MVIQATVFRTSDGMALSASTDVDGRHEVKGCLRHIKSLSKKVSKLPDRCTLTLEGFYVNLVSALGLTFVCLCEEPYPAVLAFCFLDEIQKEFILKYDGHKVNAVKRPYGLMAFDMFLQKTKQRYNNPRSLATKINLSDMSTEMRLRPPYQITPEDLEVSSEINNGFYSIPLGEETTLPVSQPSQQLEPLNWLGIMCVILNAFCLLLNFIRGATFISHGHVDEMDSGAYRHGSAFLLTATLYGYQLYLMFHYKRRRKLQACVVLATLCWCCYYLQQFRNFTQIAFHVIVALVATVIIYKRQLQAKLPGYNV